MNEYCEVTARVSMRDNEEFCLRPLPYCRTEFAKTVYFRKKMFSKFLQTSKIIFYLTVCSKLYLYLYNLFYSSDFTSR